MMNVTGATEGGSGLIATGTNTQVMSATTVRNCHCLTNMEGLSYSVTLIDANVAAHVTMLVPREPSLRQYTLPQR